MVSSQTKAKAPVLSSNYGAITFQILQYNTDKPRLRIRKIEKISFNSPQLQLGVYKYYGLALAQNLKNCF
jgi:hypothetical protein